MLQNATANLLLFLLITWYLAGLLFHAPRILRMRYPWHPKFFTMWLIWDKDKKIYPRPFHAIWHLITIFVLIPLFSPPFIPLLIITKLFDIKTASGKDMDAKYVHAVRPGSPQGTPPHKP